MPLLSLHHMNPVMPASIIVINEYPTSHRYIDVLVQDCSNSSVLAMELLQFCA